MAQNKRQRYVTVGGVIYAPDEEIPAEVAEQITNAKAFAEEDRTVITDASVEADAQAAASAEGSKSTARKTAAPAAKPEQ